MTRAPTKATDVEEAKRRLERPSPDRLKVASDFLAHLEEREESEATEELLNIPGFEEAFRRAVQQVDEGQVEAGNLDESSQRSYR